MSFRHNRRDFWSRFSLALALVTLCTSGASAQIRPLVAAKTVVISTSGSAVATPTFVNPVPAPPAVFIAAPPTTEPNLLPEAGPFAVAPGQPLPTDAQCAARVTKAPESVPANRVANHRTGKADPSTYTNWGRNPVAIAYAKRVSGNFTGTTDELIQWASCKWGFDPDPVRAQVMVESSWHQNAVAGFVPDSGKCTDSTYRRVTPSTTTTTVDPTLTSTAVPVAAVELTTTTQAPTTTTSSTVAAVDSSTTTTSLPSSSPSTTAAPGGFECPTAFGLLQLRSDYQPGSYPMSQRSTAFNLDYSLAMKRACFEGVGWLGAQTKGNAWGCVGVHYSGSWLDPDANDYIQKVQRVTAAKGWKH